MKKISTVAAKQSRHSSQPKLTIGLDLGDRSSWYCVLNESGEVVLEQRVNTTPKAMKEVFGAMPHSRIALETGMLAAGQFGWKSRRTAPICRTDHPAYLHRRRLRAKRQKPAPI